MSALQRLSLALLLALLLIGIAGHVFPSASGIHHIPSESTCPIHHGMNFPENLQSSWDKSSIPHEPPQDDSCALDLVLNIPHPPTF